MRRMVSTSRATVAQERGAAAEIRVVVGKTDNVDNKLTLENTSLETSLA